MTIVCEKKDFEHQVFLEDRYVLNQGTFYGGIVECTAELVAERDAIVRDTRVRNGGKLIALSGSILDIVTIEHGGVLYLSKDVSTHIVIADQGAVVVLEDPSLAKLIQINDKAKVVSLDYLGDLEEENPTAIVIHGKTQVPFTADDVSYFTFVVDGRGFDVYPLDDDFSFKDGELTIVLDNLPFDLEGHQVLLTDIEFNDLFDVHMGGYISFEITDASDNKGHEIGIDLCDWHSDHVATAGKVFSEVPSDPNAPHIEFDIGIFGDCNYPDIIKYLDRVCFRIKDMNCSFDTAGRCEMYPMDEQDKEDEDLKNHYGFSMLINLPSDLNDGDITLTDMRFKPDTPEDLKWKFSDSYFKAPGDEWDGDLAIELKPGHDPHLDDEID